MLSRSLSDCKSLLLNVMIQVSQFVSNSQLFHWGKGPAIRWIFGKILNGLRPSPPHFWRIILQIFYDGYGCMYEGMRYEGQRVWNAAHALHMMCLVLIFHSFESTRSCAALRAADLDWIVGPEYSLGGYIFGDSQLLRRRSVTRSHNWPGRGAGQE